MKKIILYLLIILLYSCNINSYKNEYVNLKNLGSVTKSHISLSYSDTITIDARATSLQGIWSISNEHLYFADEHIVKVLIFDTLGCQNAKLFTKGRGPQEFISPALSFIQLESGKFFFSDKNQNLFILSNGPNYLKERESNIIKAGLPKMYTNDFINNLLEHPDPDNYAMYELCFQGNDFIEFYGNILFPVTTEHIKFNGYMQEYAADFYKRSYNIIAVDTADLSISNLFCKFPPIYDSKIIPNFKNCHLASDGTELYVSFEADPNIYVYNNKYELIGYFGVIETAINTNFPQTTTVNEAEKLYKKHRNKYGYYGNLTYAGEYLFREFFTPEGEKGIQIYKDYTHVHTLLLNENKFTIIGYIYPHYYALTECNLNDETYQIVKFSIK